MKKLFGFAALLALAFTLGAAVNRIDNRVLPNGNPVLVPGVRQYEKTNGKFEIPSNFTLTVPESEKLIAELLAKALSRFGIEVKKAPENAVCRFIIDERIQFGEKPGMKKQSFSLEIAPSGIEVRASDGAGLFYGARTLCNLLNNAAKPELACCKITDWPEFDRRGIFFTVENVKDDFPKLLQLIDFYSDMKINWFLVTFSHTFPSKLPLNPNCPPNGWTREKVEKFRDFCRERHIEITPVVQVLSHAQWMIKHPNWQAISEGKPDRPWNSQPCALNEEAWNITKEYMQEQIDVFKPRTFFVMLDELFLGPHGKCPKCRAYPDKVDIYYRWVRRCEDFLKAQGIETMVCQDSFANRPEVNWMIGDELRKKLDKNDLICFWGYTDALRLDMLNLFKGFPLAGHAVFGKPLNTYNMARAIRERGGKDMTIVYWYFSGGLQYWMKMENPDSWGGLVNSADYLWGLPEQHYSAFPYDATYEMVRRFTPGKAVPAAVKEYQPVRLNANVNAELSHSGKFPRLDDRMTAELKREAALLPEKFQILTAPGGRYYGLRLSGSKTAAKQGGREGIGCDIPGNRKIERLAFLLTAGRPDNLLDYHSARVYGKKRFKFEPALEIRLKYADGSDCTSVLRYRQEFNDWNRPFGGFNMRWVLRGRDLNHAYFSFGVYDFINPHPEKPVKGFSMSTRFLDGISPVLLAVSASGCDGKLAPMPKHFKPEAIRRPYREKVPGNCEPRIICGFEQDMGGYKVDNPQNIKYKLERVTDETKPGTGKTVLKITFYPDKRMNLRLDLIAPQRFEKTPWGLSLCCRVNNPDAVSRIMTYVVDENFKHYRSFRSRPETTWKYFYHDLQKPVENRMTDTSAIRISKQSIFFNALDQGCELYLDDLGVLDSYRDVTPYWGIATDAEPL